MKLGDEVNRSILTWARETAGFALEDAASELELTAGEVRDLEAGQAPLTIGRLEKLARLYRRPVALFFLPDAPNDVQRPPDFRTLPSGKRSPLSPATIFAIREARRLQEIAKELVQPEDEATTKRPGELDVASDPERASLELRERMGVGVDEQAGWQTLAQALRRWRGAVESLGVFAFRLKFPADEARGFSLADPRVPALVLSASDATAGNIFTLLHELGHILLRGEALCLPVEASQPRATDTSATARVETFCNRFAAAALMPAEDVRRERTRCAIGEAAALAERLARTFKVSREAMLRRLSSLKLVSEDDVREALALWDSLPQPARKTGGRASPAQKCISQQGYRFVELVIAAAERRRIGPLDVSRYLGVKLRHRDEVMKRLWAAHE